MKKFIVFLAVLAIALVIVLSTEKTMPKPQLEINDKTSFLGSNPWLPISQFEKYQKYFHVSLIKTESKKEIEEKIREEFK